MAQSNGTGSQKVTAAEFTSLLPPLSAVRMAWALTGAFAKDDSSKRAAQAVENRMEYIIDRAEKANTTKKEKEYVLNAIIGIKASMRSLETAYKGRNLNFQENEKLREVYLESVREGFDYGKKAKDFLTSLPGTSIGGAGGITLASLLGAARPVVLWGVAIALAGVGFFVNVVIVQYCRKRKQSLYVAQDYDRDLYYEHYISQVSLILTSLYSDVDRIHRNVFGQEYPAKTDAPANIVADLLKGVSPPLCKFVHKHMRQKKITPRLWSLCEAGSEAAKKECPLWE